MPLRVAYQGEPGAYSEQAVLTLFKQRTDVTPVPRVTFSAVFESVASGTADCALVPIENSLGGSIHDNYDLLVSHDVIVQAEIEFQVHHCLMALPSQTLQSIHTVQSHPQALAQCEDYINNLGLQAVKQYDTAGSAKLIAEQRLEGVAAIASSHAAEVYGLKVLAHHIEDDENNFTRFLLVSKPQTAGTTSLLASPLVQPSASGAVKTSIVFALKDEAGVLFKALSVFALRDIHLSKIESRPGKRLKALLSVASNEVRLDDVGGAGAGGSGGINSLFKYLFYLDLLAHAQETRAQNALNHLREIAPFLRILGSYPASSASAAALSAGELRRPSTSAALTVGIIGFGTFGQFLAKAMVKRNWRVLATSRTDYSEQAESMGVDYCSTTALLVEQKPDVIVVSVSILSFADTVASFPWQSLPPHCVVVDVLSVKLHPKSILLSALPPHLSILCTHPMFGPDSGKYSWKGLPLMYDKVRVHSHALVDSFLSLFHREGCRMLEMSCELHDSYAAGSQFITHTTGRVLSKLGCESTPINTKGYSQLLEVIGNTCRDSWDLYRGLYVFNPHSRVQLEGFERAFQSIKADLIGREGTTNGAVVKAGPIEERKERSSAQDEMKDTAVNANGIDSARQSFNPRVLSMNESKTAQVTDLAKQLQAAGHKIVSLSVGEPIDIPTPTPVVEAAIAALRSGQTKYTPVAGLLELRRAIVAKLRRENGLDYTVDEVVVSNGAKQSILQAVMALSCEGDEVVIPAPYWVSYPDMCVLSGSHPVIVDTTASGGFIMSAQQLRGAMTERSKLLILCSPSNPTGGVYTRDELQALADVLADYPRCWVISDEIYEHLLFDGATHTSFASLSGMRDRTVTVNGFSKCYSMTGFRLGYIAAPLQVAQLCNKVQGQITSCASSISQHAGIAALAMDSAEFTRSMCERLRAKRDLVVSVLRSTAAVTLTTPKGAFYAMPDISAYFGRYTRAGERLSSSDDVCVWLLSEYKVALVPGSAFGAPRTVRISYASEESEVRAGVMGLKQCLEELVVR